MLNKKVEKRLQDKNNHPFWGKHNYDKIKFLISKLRLLNPMFGKSHSEETNNLMRSRKVKYPNRVGIYELDNRLLKSFYYGSYLAVYLSVSKVTVGKYINKGLLFQR